MGAIAVAPIGAFCEQRSGKGKQTRLASVSPRITPSAK